MRIALQLLSPTGTEREQQLQQHQRPSLLRKAGNALVKCVGSSCTAKPVHPVPLVSSPKSINNYLGLHGRHATTFTRTGTKESILTRLPANGGSTGASSSHASSSRPASNPPKKSTASIASSASTSNRPLKIHDGPHPSSTTHSVPGDKGKGRAPAVEGKGKAPARISPSSSSSSSPERHH